MSGPSCETCAYYHPQPFDGGECADPAKIIDYKYSGPKNSAPEVGKTDECCNHTGLGVDEAWLQAAAKVLGMVLIPVEPTEELRDLFDLKIAGLYTAANEHYRFSHYWKALVAKAKGE